jgi:hypothetical protein
MAQAAIKALHFRDVYYPWPNIVRLFSVPVDFDRSNWFRTQLLFCRPIADNFNPVVFGWTSFRGD